MQKYFPSPVMRSGAERETSRVELLVFHWFSHAFKSTLILLGCESGNIFTYLYIVFTVTRKGIKKH